MSNPQQQSNVEEPIASQFHCQASGDHYYASNSVPSSQLINWVRICMTCGDVDGKDLDNEVTRLIKEADLKARIDELENIDDKLYDINSSEWGIPTKWTKDNYADLWSPNNAIHEVVTYEISQLKALQGGKK